MAGSEGVKTSVAMGPSGTANKMNTTSQGEFRDNDDMATLRRPGSGCLVCSFHPSQQNTFTGRLTESMLDEVFLTARELAQLEPA